MLNHIFYTLHLNLLDSATKKLHKTSQKKLGDESSHYLLCKICEEKITHENNRIAINTSHEHDCVNPAGVNYQIGCFDQAPGCTCIGPASIEHTWFPGYYWQISLCSNCHEHIGWCFKNNDSFYGLILNRLKAA